MQYLRRAEARDKLKISEKRLSQNLYERGVDDIGFARMPMGTDSLARGCLKSSFFTELMIRFVGATISRPQTITL